MKCTLITKNKEKILNLKIQTVTTAHTGEPENKVNWSSILCPLFSPLYIDSLPQLSIHNPNLHSFLMILTSTYVTQTYYFQVCINNTMTKLSKRCDENKLMPNYVKTNKYYPTLYFPTNAHNVKKRSY